MSIVINISFLALYMRTIRSYTFVLRKGVMYATAPNAFSLIFSPSSKQQHAPSPYAKHHLFANAPPLAMQAGKQAGATPKCKIQE
jgi:hypothetical protein